MEHMNYNTIPVKELIQSALLARENAYTPYSHYKVGAALLSSSGKIITGCNVENASYGVTNCAERTAFFSAVSQGERSFFAIAICGGLEGEELDMAFPCGVCRQVMMEFCNPQNFSVIVAKDTDHYEIYPLEELLPHGFGPGNLGV